MKRIIQIGILISFILVFGCKSKAAYDVPEEKVIQLQQDIYDNFGLTIPTDNAEFMIYYWNLYPFDGKSAYMYQETSFTQIRIIVTDNGTMSGSSVSATQPWYLITWNYNDNMNTTNANTYGSLSVSNVIELGLYSDYGVDPVYYYDATLPTPKFSIFVLDLPDFLGLPREETNYFGIDFPNPDSRYKLDVVYRTILPEDISIGLSNGKITYQPLFYQHSVWTYAYHDYAVSVNTDLDDDDFWWIAPVMPNFTTNVPAWQSNPNAAAYVNAQDAWNDNYKYCLPLYGNRIEICARYYYENGNDVYVGPWMQWVNTYPSTYNDQVPANYVSGDYLPGIQGTENNESLPENVISSGEVTGPTTTTSITINQAVPNYPDYPTAASYNHDNVLLQWIQTSLQLPGMFGQFGAFLTSAFTFIPSSFWTIVGFGLMCCIAIMIVKVL